MSDDNLTLPSSKQNPIIEVFYMKGDPPFICGANGKINIPMLGEIEQDLEDNEEDSFPSGDGTYLFQTTYFTGQYDEMGRCELSPCWELDLLKFYEIEP